MSIKNGQPGNHMSRDSRRKEAAERQEAFSKLNNFQRIDLLDARLGKGVGAVKQRAKIQARKSKNA